MARRGYIFTNKRHSVFGIMSAVFGALSLATYCLCIYRSYRGYAEPQRLGVSAFFATIFLAAGFLLGAISVMESERFLLFRVLGLVINALALLALSAILYAGAYVT